LVHYPTPLANYPFNYSGQPAVSVPAGWTASGLPVDLEIIGRRLENALVLRRG
jgi:aspartyl-tRNA(Asn)/glutamyl-tRNA(Gln) amidotransferase subunit A